MLRRPDREQRTNDEGGFTLIELAVATVIFGVMTSITAGALISMQNTTSRNNAMVDIEQDASNTLAMMARDIRSAHSIGFLSSTSDAADAVVLYVNQPSGSTVPVEWVYQPPTAPATVGTLSRVVLTSSLAVTGTAVILSDVANGVSPVFSYFNLNGGSGMATSGTSANQTLQDCTTAIGVNLTIQPPSVKGAGSFSESDQVAITDQEQILSAPGNQQCGLTS
ncbi:MAG TPA: prepilin-type N-terminal cleavage/methylation domain-containing protein [Acidimicrobiales bacterium]|nr:prepilin-type N-terminal cleavage/methylation domain-containing protein [Acidimicrobiales bacterium]